MNSQKCNKHDQIPIFYNSSQLHSMFKNLCSFCISQFKNEEFQRQQIILIQENEERCNNNISLLHQIKENTLQYKQKVIVILEALIKTTDQQINLIKKSTKKCTQLINQIPIINAEQFIKAYSQIKTQLPNYQNIKDILLSQIRLLNSSNLIHEVEDNFKYFGEDYLNHTIYKRKHKIDSENSPSNQIQKKFKYELLQKFSIKQTDTCNAIAINKDSQIVAAGCKENIKIFELKDGQLDEVQVVSEHSKNVNCLTFIGNSNSFISGSDDNTIRIWTKQQNNIWMSKQTLDRHTDQVYCLTVNNQEDLIISGSQDKSIIFWGRQNDWLQIQTINSHKDSIYRLCLNEQSNKLISC